MDNTIKQTYYEIVYSLLINSEAQSPEILDSHLGVLADEEFVPFLREVCATLVERNCEEDAERLTDFATQIEEAGSIATWIEQNRPATPPPPPPKPEQPVAVSTQTPASKPPQPQLDPKVVTEKQSKAEELFKRGIQEFQGNQFQEAFKSWQEALILYQEVQNYRGAINCMGKLGNVYHSLGQYEQAIEAHKQCLALARKTQYPQGEANAYSSLAHVCYAVGQHEQALFGYRQALEIAQKINYRFGEVNVLGSLGQLYSTLGRHEEAIAHIGEAATKAGELGYRFGETNFLANLGSAYAAVGQFDRATAAHHQALKIARGINYDFGVANSLSNIGTTYQLKGDFDQAIAYYQQHLQIARQIPSPQGEAIAFMNLGNTYRLKEDWAAAVEQYQQALAIAREMGDIRQEVTAVNNLGQIYQITEQWDEAIRVFRESLEKATSLTLPMDCLLAGRHLGDIGFNQDNWELAIEGYSRAIEALEQSCSGTMTSPRRSEIVAEATGLYDRIIQAYINGNSEDAGGLERAFEYGERSRIQQWVSLLSREYGGADQELTELLDNYHRFQQQMDTLHFRRQSEEMKQFAAAGIRMNHIAIFRAETYTLNGLETEKQRMWAKIRDRDPVLAGILRVDPLEKDRISALISNSVTALLSFYITEVATHVFVLRRGTADDPWAENESLDISLHTCRGQGRENFGAWLADYWLQPEGEKTASWRDCMAEMLAELSRRLELDRLISEHLDGIQDLLILPHLGLHRCPFVALPISGGEDYLGDRFRVTMAPSFQVLDLSRQVREGRSQTVSHLPTLSADTSLGLAESSRPESLLTGYECAALAECFEVSEDRYLKGENLSRDHYQKLLNEVQVLYGGHGIKFNSDTPLSSQIDLFSESISLQHLLSLRSPKLLEVCLSRREAIGSNSTPKTEQLLNFTSAFLCMGASTAIAPLWCVGEISTAILIQLYYHYRRELGVAEALQKARIRLRSLSQTEFSETYEVELLAYLEQIQGQENSQEINDQKTSLATLKMQDYPFSHPYYWAAFSAFGLG
ncbi:MAG: CHAT domain-containing protein [Limnospira sp.]